MTVTHNGQQYTFKQLNADEWQLTSVSNPRDKLTLNREQMSVAGLLEQVSSSCTVDLNKARAAQNKIVIARFLGDAHMWHQAVQEYGQATGARP